VEGAVDAGAYPAGGIELRQPAEGPVDFLAQPGALFQKTVDDGIAGGGQRGDLGENGAGGAAHALGHRLQVGGPDRLGRKIRPAPPLGQDPVHLGEDAAGPGAAVEVGPAVLQE